MTTSEPDPLEPAPVPEVDNATDLSLAPVVHAGTGAAPRAFVAADLVVGTGDAAPAASTVLVHYVGALYDTGETFDSSWGRGPATFGLNQVIAGFARGIAGMRVGGRREMVIPSDLGYGAAGAPPVIPGHAALVFVVDLLGVS